MDDEAFYNALDMDGGDEHALDGGKKAECTGMNAFELRYISQYHL
jgi:hypothetical protein